MTEWLLRGLMCLGILFHFILNYFRINMDDLNPEAFLCRINSLLYFKQIV